MAFTGVIQSSFHFRFRALAFAGLAIAAAVAACGKIDDLTGSGSDDGGKITISLAATSVPPSSQTTFTVSAKDKDGKPAADGTVVVLTVDKLGTVTPTAVTLTGGTAGAQFAAGTAEGTSTITAAGLGAKQTATVTISKSASQPPTGTTPAGDAIDITKVRWVGLAGPVGNYKYNSTVNLRNITISNPAKPTICWSSNNPPNWPVDRRAGVTVGNLWVFIKQNGVWYSAPIEWILKNQGSRACTTMENIPPQPPFIQGKGDPVASYFPKSGETLGFMITSLPSTFSAPPNPPNERSSIVLGTYP